MVEANKTVGPPEPECGTNGLFVWITFKRSESREKVDRNGRCSCRATVGVRIGGVGIAEIVGACSRRANVETLCVSCDGECDGHHHH